MKAGRRPGTPAGTVTNRGTRWTSRPGRTVCRAREVLHVPDGEGRASAGGARAYVRRGSRHPAPGHALTALPTADPLRVAVGSHQGRHRGDRRPGAVRSGDAYAARDGGGHLAGPAGRLGPRALSPLRREHGHRTRRRRGTPARPVPRGSATTARGGGRGSGADTRAAAGVPPDRTGGRGHLQPGGAGPVAGAAPGIRHPGP